MAIVYGGKLQWIGQGSENVSSGVLVKGTALNSGRTYGWRMTILCALSQTFMRSPNQKALRLKRLTIQSMGM